MCKRAGKRPALEAVTGDGSKASRSQFPARDVQLVAICVSRWASEDVIDRDDGVEIEISVIPDIEDSKAVDPCCGFSPIPFWLGVCETWNSPCRVRVFDTQWRCFREYLLGMLVAIDNASPVEVNDFLRVVDASKTALVNVAVYEVKISYLHYLAGRDDFDFKFFKRKIVFWFDESFK